MASRRRSSSSLLVAAFLLLAAAGPALAAAPAGVGGTSATAGAATFGNYSLASVPFTNSAGEPSIGVSWATGDVYMQAGLTTVKAVFPSYDIAAQPALTDVTCLADEANSLDPIGYVDPDTGRVFNSQLQANPVGINSITQYFDDTTASSPTGSQLLCSPSQGGGVIAGPDHQTLGGGVYPTTLPIGVLGPTGAYPHAVYYCSQAIEASICSRSDDGGTTFTDSTTATTTIEGCGGLHGHVRVGPEGNVYLPNKSCNGTAGLAVSTTAGMSFTVHPVTGSTVGTTDPSVSADRAGKVYFGWTGADGIPAIATSTDGGTTWGPVVRPGDALGIKRAVWAETIAGDDGRAAFAFMGSTTAGDSDALTYGEDSTGTTYTGGAWDVYVAITVDGGQTYRTVKVTDTPAQRGSICTAGTTCSSTPNTRNLLDFMDITLDKTGHVLVGYADGCTGACVTSTKVSDNPLDAQGVIAREVDGPLLFSTTTADTPVPESGVPVELLLTGLAGAAVVLTVRRARGRRAGTV